MAIIPSCWVVFRRRGNLFTGMGAGFGYYRAFVKESKVRKKQEKSQKVVRRLGFRTHF
jgi:hypothetical protein